MEGAWKFAELCIVLHLPDQLCLSCDCSALFKVLGSFGRALKQKQNISIIKDLLALKAIKQS